ncbi:MAG TPA: HoxN/HupN/NixA family nickel/cobalt transporter [Solirubrobacteraceae bacterium]|jgi:high-affinity nickel-transport protein|nr:HoxN/HupN/NixA family nickel/cobalt transporter [Solirubrobacteraceae bacterium]
MSEASHTRRERLRGAMTRREWRRAGLLAAAVVGLHVVGFGTLLLFVVPRHLSLGHTGIFGVGLGITAYTLGLRHALDADHIAAIDSATRKLMAEGKRPLGIGFSFSLGHSTIVLVMSVLLAAGINAVGSQVRQSGSTLHQVTGLLGTSVSGLFLYLIAALNAAILVGILRAAAQMRRGGAVDQRELEEQLASLGLMNRILRPVSRRVRSSWHMYPVGVLFGLGFDTASEVALLFLAAGAATSGLPVYAILCLPVLFAAGMSLLDTIDGSFMNFAYGWAFSRPARKLYYNLTITGQTVAVAFIVGSIELLSIAAPQLGLRGGFWRWIAGIDLNTVGYVIVGLFALSWMVALAVWRLGRIEEKWSPGAAAA